MITRAALMAEAARNVGPNDPSRVPAMTGGELVMEARRLARLNQLSGTLYTAAVLDALCGLLEKQG